MSTLSGGVRDTNVFDAMDKFYESKDHFMTVYNLIVHKQLMADTELRLMRDLPKRPGRGRTRTKFVVPVTTLKFIQYAVTTYATAGAIVLVEGRPVSVSSVIAAGMARYGRGQYSAFRRGDAFDYSKHGLTMNVTLGQLLFYRDMIRYGILEYIFNHRVEIRAQMKKTMPNSETEEIMRGRRRLGVFVATGAKTRITHAAAPLVLALKHY